MDDTLQVQPAARGTRFAPVVKATFVLLLCGGIALIGALVEAAERELGARGTVGVGIPGSLSPAGGLVRGANSTWLNGGPLDRDLTARLGRPVRLSNDANCLAMSEAADGAAAGFGTVFAVILGIALVGLQAAGYGEAALTEFYGLGDMPGLIAIPLGTLVGLYLSEYASLRVRAVVKPALEILAGIPTVVYGYFGVFFVTPLLRVFFPSVEVFNAASGAIVVGIMILPLVSSLCEDALSAVPRSLREGAYALGATKFEVSWRTVFPAALSGIMASFVLALSRAIGETMAVTLAAGMSPKLTFNPAQSIQTMTAYIVQISRGDTPAGTVEYQTIFAVGVTLFAFTMAMNILAIRLVKRFRQVYS